MLLLCLFGFDFMGSAKELYEDRGAERKEDCEHVAVSPFTIPPPPQFRIFRIDAFASCISNVNM